MNRSSFACSCFSYYFEHSKKEREEDRREDRAYEYCNLTWRARCACECGRMQSSDLGLPLLANESESERTSTADFESGWLAMKEEHRGCCLRGLWTRRYCRFDKTGNGRLTVFEDDGHGPGGQVHCFAVHNCAELPSRMCKRSGRFDLEVSDELKLANHQLLS